MALRPTLITFDIFGTILDWRTGLEEACRAASRPLHGADFDRVVDAQTKLEKDDFRDYATITCSSLVDVLGLHPDKAAEIGANVGCWPLYPDAGVLRPLMGIAPCAAMTNSDHRHGEDVQAQLGFRLDAWLCAQEVRVYKPDPEFWREMGRLRGIEPGPGWWHVSAYADYDLQVANDLGLTTVLVQRPHARPGSASHVVADLAALLHLLS